MKNIYQQNNSFEKRSALANKLKTTYPDHIPIVIEQANIKQPIVTKQTKFLTKKDQTVGQFLFSLRKQLEIRDTDAIFLFCSDDKGSVLAPTNTLLDILYQKYHDTDGILYLWISGENTFG